MCLEHVGCCSSKSQDGWPKQPRSSKNSLAQAIKLARYNDAGRCRHGNHQSETVEILSAVVLAVAEVTYIRNPCRRQHGGVPILRQGEACQAVLSLSGLMRRPH
jgi:hypothetical protein